MRYLLIIAFAFIWLSTFGCSKQTPPGIPVTGGGTTTPVVSRRPASIGIIGDTANVTKAVNGGMVLMGGGTDVETAFKWMMDRSGGGDVVIIRVSGTDAYNSFVNKIAAVNSVETLKIDTRELANNDTVANIIRNAEMLFIAGGDQSDYMRLWKGTKTEKALNYLLQEKKAPFGGTSAGCAILGGFYFSGENGSVVSDEALANPFASNINLYNNDFLHAPFLENVITDQHYLTRSREGRSIVFLGKIYNDFNLLPKGIAVDEKTAVCIDKDGKAQVFGSSSAYFLLPDANKLPEQFLANKPMVWKQNDKAIQVYEITGSLTGNGNFNLANFSTTEANGGTWFWWNVDNGKLIKLKNINN
ncbi:cyanophycinase [Pedobacter sp. CG_S7]|uniref:cyanophycinase n=1 Tax=Pedobacter sp. CG_S7 TaxID=3143930 RepID=UPI003398C144